jgi:hypothetical protein
VEGTKGRDRRREWGVGEGTRGKRKGQEGRKRGAGKKGEKGREGNFWGRDPPPNCKSWLRPWSGEEL